jgi:hypothetical protein
MATISTEQLNRELSQLKQAGFAGAVYAIGLELKRRAGSAFNAGKKPLYDDPKHIAWRKASRAYRQRKTEQAGDTEIYDEVS